MKLIKLGMMIPVMTLVINIEHKVEYPVTENVIYEIGGIYER